MIGVYGLTALGAHVECRLPERHPVVRGAHAQATDFPETPERIHAPMGPFHTPPVASGTMESQGSGVQYDYGLSNLIALRQRPLV